MCSLWYHGVKFGTRLDQTVLRWRMRKLLLLILCGAMLIGGICIAILTLVSDGTRLFFIGGSLLAIVGAYLIWTDFIAPRFGIQTWEDSPPRR